MMTIKPNNSGKGHFGQRGFSLIELMIVVAILGILGAAVRVAISGEDAKLRSFVFNLGSRFKQAKFESMKRGHDVYLDFDFNADNILDNGYTIWSNNNEAVNNTYDPWTLAEDFNGNGVCDDNEGKDCLIATVVLPNKANPLVDHPGPEIYNTTITGGPNLGPSAEPITDGITVANNRFRFQPSGDCTVGSAYFYFPEGPAGAKAVGAGPWMIAANNVGRIRIREWRPNVADPATDLDANGWPIDK